MPAAAGFRKNNYKLKPSIGLEPRETRRQLEQQRQELPFVESQQELAVEPQQQHRFAGWLHTPSSEVGTDVSTEPDGFGALLWRRIVNGVSTLPGWGEGRVIHNFLPNLSICGQEFPYIFTK